MHRRNEALLLSNGSVLRRNEALLLSNGPMHRRNEALLLSNGSVLGSNEAFLLCNDPVRRRGKILPADLGEGLHVVEAGVIGVRSIASIGDAPRGVSTVGGGACRGRDKVTPIPLNPTQGSSSGVYRRGGGTLCPTTHELATTAITIAATASRGARRRQSSQDQAPILVRGRRDFLRVYSSSRPLDRLPELATGRKVFFRLEWDGVCVSSRDRGTRIANPSVNASSAASGEPSFRSPGRHNDEPSHSSAGSCRVAPGG